MLKKDLMECIDYAFIKIRRSLEIWNDLCMQQIRLNTANRRRIEENRNHNMMELDEKKRLRYLNSKQAKYDCYQKEREAKP
jgi:hypothetical protein